MVNHRFSDRSTRLSATMIALLGAPMRRGLADERPRAPRPCGGRVEYQGQGEPVAAGSPCFSIRQLRAARDSKTSRQVQPRTTDAGIRRSRGPGRPFVGNASRPIVIGGTNVCGTGSSAVSRHLRLSAVMEADPGRSHPSRGEPSQLPRAQPLDGWSSFSTSSAATSSSTGLSPAEPSRSLAA